MPILQTQLSMLSVIQKCIHYKSLPIKDYEQQLSLWVAQLSEHSAPIQELAQKVSLNLHTFCNKK